MMKQLKQSLALMCALVLLWLCMPLALAAEYTGTINENSVFFRTSPSTGAAFHGRFDKGDKVTVCGTSGDFYKVKADGKTGYVMKKFVSTSSSSSSASVAANVSNRAGMNGIKKISDIKVPATSRRGDEGPDVKALQQALTLKGFYNTTIDGDYGYNTEQAVKKFQKSIGLAQDGVAGAATIRALFGKNPASTSSSSASTVKATATPKPSSGRAGMEGITKISDIPVPATSKPGDSGSNVKALQQALTLKGFYNTTIDGSYGNNTKNAVMAFQKSKGLSRDGIAGEGTIRALFGKNPSSVITAKPTATPKPAVKKGMEGITKIGDIDVPAVSKKGDSGSNVKALQQALTLKGFYHSTIDGNYGENTVKAVKAFQKSKGLAQDGVAGAGTIRALFGKNPKATATPKPTAKPTVKPTATPKKYKTERLDWFNGGANVIPRGATFQVKDVATGKVFTVRRWAGANHIDAEPKTAADTATMKAIYGGSWSWNRRAVLVKYNGHVYAGSMNGMPHGTSTISGNNFNGHFCIHFYKSRTHETNRVDAAHQNAVARAMNNTW